MGLLNNSKNGGAMDVIRCDEQDYLVWKWRPLGASLGETRRENEIRWGSSLHVKEGSVAIFTYSSDNGTVQDYIEGPSDTIVDTKNLPSITSIIGLAYNGDSPFQAEVYFVNLANTIQMKFAVPYFDVFDSNLPEFGVPVAVRGSVDFNICDYKEFIKKHRLDNFSLSNLRGQVGDTVSEKVKYIVANAPETYNIPVVHLEKRISEIKEEILSLLKVKLFGDYGVTLSDINIEAIDIDKESEGYKELKAVTKDLTIETLRKRNKAKNTAESRDIKGNQRVELFGKAADKLVDIKENQFSRHKKAQSEYAEVIEDKRAGKIGAIGGKLIRDIGKVTHSDNKKTSGVTPPPLPVEDSFYVAIDGNATGPFKNDELSKMVEEGQLTGESLVWKKGMKEWEKATNVEALKDIISSIPPISSRN